MSLQTTLISVSKKYNLTNRDLWQGLIMAIYGAVGGQLYAIAMEWLKSDSFIVFDKVGLMAAAKGAVIAAASYLFKRWRQGPQIIISNVPVKTAEAVKEGAAVKVAGATIAQVDTSNLQTK